MKENKRPGANPPRDSAELTALLSALQAEQQRLLADAIAKAALNEKRATAAVEALTRENELLKQQVAELREQIAQLKGLAPKK